MSRIMTKRRGHRRGHGHGRKNKRTMRRRRSHSAHLTRSRRHHRHGSRSRARRGGLKEGDVVKIAKALKQIAIATDRNKRNERTEPSSRPLPSASSVKQTTPFKYAPERISASRVAESLSVPSTSGYSASHASNARKVKKSIGDRSARMNAILEGLTYNPQTPTGRIDDK